MPNPFFSYLFHASEAGTSLVLDRFTTNPTPHHFVTKVVEFAGPGYDSLVIPTACNQFRIRLSV